MPKIEKKPRSPDACGREETAAVGRGRCSAEGGDGGWQSWLLAAALAAAVFVAYYPAWHGDFLWDDDLHLLDNPVLKPGGLLRAWVPGSYINYWPLTFTVYRLEFALWKLNPLGFHLVNIGLHALAAILVWRVLVELGTGGALAAAALFALHPVNVESVAWIAQLKGLLALVLALVALLFYLRHDRRGGAGRYAAALVAFWLSTLAKGIVITLPLILLACAWWRRGSIGRRDLVRVLPFALIAALMTGVEIWSQQVVVGAGEDVRADSLLTRTAVAGCAVWFYLGKLAWPLDLCFAYPRWQIDGASVLSYLPGLALALLLALAWWGRRTWGRPVVMLLVCYVGLLAPVLGFVNIYFMRYSLVADHWQYPATIVPCATVAGIVASWLGRGPRGRAIGWGLCLAATAILGVLTWRQSRMYGAPETLYETTLTQNPGCWMARNNLGLILTSRGQFDAAIDHFRRALESYPKHARARCNLGYALARRGELEEAVVEYRKALDIDPNLAGAYINLGDVLDGRGEIDAAIDHYRKAVDVQPDLADAHNSLGKALLKRGKAEELGEAIEHFRAALALNADLAEAHNNLAAALHELGRDEEAIDHLRRAVEIKPEYAVGRLNLGDILAGRGRVEEALEQYREALRLATAQKKLQLAEQIRQRIGLYRPEAPVAPGP